MRKVLLAAAITGSLTVAMNVHAHEGHDHGPEVSASQTLPRVVAASDLFELVGVLEGKRLTLFLDLTKDNAPIAEAKIALESGSLKLEAKPAEDATFVIDLPNELPPGDHAMTFTVAVQGESDLLAGNLHLDSPAPAVVASSRVGLRQIATWSGVGAFALMALGFVAAVFRKLVRTKGAGA